jgi:hypothetical protein
MSISKIIPKFNGEGAENMDSNWPTLGVILEKVSVLGRKFGDTPKKFEQLLLIRAFEGTEKIENFNRNEQA